MKSERKMRNINISNDLEWKVRKTGGYGRETRGEKRRQKI